MAQDDPLQPLPPQAEPMQEDLTVDAEVADTDDEGAADESDPVLKPDEEMQGKLVETVRKTVEQYSELLKPYRERMLEVYRAYSTYKEEKRADWSTSFKVNKCHEIVEKVLPRIIARNPRWLVSPRMDNFYPDEQATDEMGQPVEDPHSIPEVSQEDPTFPQYQASLRMAWEKWIAYQNKKFKQTEEFCEGIQDYLTYIFKQDDLNKKMRMFAKSGVAYGKCIAQVCYKYETVNLYQGVDQNGQAIMEENVRGEYPTIEICSWADVLWDPRYLCMRDQPAVVRVKDSVRFGDLQKNPDKYFNLDKLKNVLSVTFGGDKENGAGMEDYKKKIQSIAGLNTIDITKPIDKNQLKLTCYYGYFQADLDTEESMYEIWVVGSGTALLFPIYTKKITRIPFVDFNCFEDTELDMPVGFIEPIISLQDELNFKKNSASEYINNALNRSWLWSAQSGVDPRDLISRPNGIIVTTNSVTEAKANLEELTLRQIDPSFFQEQNDFERQIQSASFTVDTSNQRNQQALTNTATGIRVAFFESNSVIDEVRKHWEAAMTQLAYQLLQETFENMEDNIVLKKLGQAGFWEMHKELLRNALMRYNIEVESNSSSFDDLENRREDSVALWNMAKDAAKSGVNVDLDEFYRDILLTFEKKDPNKYIRPKSIAQLVAQIMGPPAGQQKVGGGNVEAPPAGGPPSPAELTQQVAGGATTSAVNQ